jgi:hypothetical protein
MVVRLPNADKSARTQQRNSTYSGHLEVSKRTSSRQLTSPVDLGLQCFSGARLGKEDGAVVSSWWSGFVDVLSSGSDANTARCGPDFRKVAQLVPLSLMAAPVAVAVRRFPPSDRLPPEASGERLRHADKLMGFIGCHARDLGGPMSTPESPNNQTQACSTISRFNMGPRLPGHHQEHHTPQLPSERSWDEADGPV